jgi:hypothetical protein
MGNRSGGKASSLLWRAAIAALDVTYVVLTRLEICLTAGLYMTCRHGRMQWVGQQRSAVDLFVHVACCCHCVCPAAADCALDMCERCPLGTAVCPFCRCIIKSFVPVCPDKPASAPGLTAAKPALAAAPMVLPVC